MENKTDYKKLYLLLFNAITDMIESQETTLNTLKNIQIQCEEMILSETDDKNQ